jgi:type II secretory pathway pseudopilin PulG
MRANLKKQQINRTGIRKRDGLFKCERGALLIEILVGIALLGIIGTTFLAGLSSTSKTLITMDELQTAKSLAQSQMEYVKYQPYVIDYPPDALSGEYANAGYSVTIETAEIRDAAGHPTRDLNIQKIRITVSHQGRPIITADNCTLAGYKVN